jgi:hypothetical protein
LSPIFVSAASLNWWHMLHSRNTFSGIAPLVLLECPALFVPV